MQVKICGVTNLEDALAASEFGADALGFIFAPHSPRYIHPEKAAEIIKALPAFVTSVGVFTTGTIEDIQEIISFCRLDRVQFHGPFSYDIIEAFSNRAIQVLKIKDTSSLEQFKAAPARALLLDTYDKSLEGGSGICFDWQLAVAAKQFGPIILAGGLTPDNIQEAIQKVHPYGVDVSTGVELKKGKKDHRKLKKFIELAKEIQSAASK